MLRAGQTRQIGDQEQLGQLQKEKGSGVGLRRLQEKEWGRSLSHLIEVDLRPVGISYEIDAREELHVDFHTMWKRYGVP